MYLIKKGFCTFLFILQIIVKSRQSESANNFEILKVINKLSNKYKESITLQKSNTINFKDKDLNLHLNHLRNSDRTWNTNDPIVERICKKTSCSCGKWGYFCNDEDAFKVANDVENIIDYIDRHVSIDYNDNADNYHLRCGNNRCKLKHVKNLKKYIKQSFSDILHDDSSEANIGNQTLLEAVISELDEISKANQKLLSPVALTPEDIYNYYRAGMDALRATLMGFIKYRTDLKTVRGLPKEVRSGIQTIRDKYRHFKMSDKLLKQQIFQVLLDYMLKIKIVPNKDSQILHDVFLPSWMYSEVLKKKGKMLRSEKRLNVKRVLPLTSQQKTRMQNRQGAKKLLKFVWRRSLDSKLGQYGVPFTLDIQGLGQLN